MNIDFLENSNQNLLIFFNGFGLDLAPFTMIDNISYSILHINKYDKNLDFDKILDISQRYEKKILLSFSLGVYFAGLFLGKYQVDFVEKIAINGTLMPINTEFGIDPKMYDMTIDLFNEKGQLSFYKNMFNNKKEFEIFLSNKPNRNFEEQKKELIAIKSIIKQNSNILSQEFFTKVFISKNDRIIPTKSQINFWKKYLAIESGHFPFYVFNIFNEISERFS